jgi:signal transduction histidine kinase/transcriptional regulator with GAF, ATPase, and Fis domain
MKSRSVSNLIFVTLMALTLIVLLLNLPDAGIVSAYSGPLILYALLTAFALFFAAALLQGELSAAHAIGVLAALSLPIDTRDSMTWAIAIGGLLGGILVAFAGERRLPGQSPQDRTVRAILMMSARVCIPYYSSAFFFTLIGGALPIRLDDPDQIVRIILFCTVYTGFYFLIFLMETYGRAYGLWRILRVNNPEIMTVLGLPLPLAVLGAHIYNNLSLLAFAICMIGLGLAILAPYIISRTQKQLRKQVEELRSLSVMSQAIRANYETRSLMNLVYIQVSNLLETDNFTVALYHPIEKQLEFPLVIREGQQIDIPRQPLPPNTPLSRVLETQLPLLLERDAAKEGWIRGLSAPEGTYSWLGVPLQAGGSLYGAMVVSSPNAHRIFTSDDLRLLNIVAANTSVALENSQLYERQTERAGRLALLNTTLAELTGSLSPDAVLDTIVSNALPLANAQAVSLMMSVGTGIPHTLARSAGLSETFIASIPQPLLAADVEQTQPILVGNARDDARALPIREQLSASNLSAWMELPLLASSGRLGVMTLYYQYPQSFADEDIELLRAFATQAAQAILNAREYRRADDALSRRVGQLMALATISHEMTATLDARSICALVLEFALNATVTHIGTVMLADEFGELDVMAQYGYPLESVSRRALLAQPITRRVFETGEPTLILDLSREEAVEPLLPTIRAQVAAPIVRSGTVIGVMTLESEEIDNFTPEDKEFIQQLSDQAVIAIDNTRLFQDIREARDRLRLILDNMSEPLLLIDRAGVIALANPRVDKLGFHPDILLGQTVESLLSHPDFYFAERLGFADGDEVRALVGALGTAAIDTPAPHAYKLEVREEPIYLERNIMPVRGVDGRGIGLMMVFYDETEARQLALAREDFSRMIIHDLRGPLTAVTTSLKLMNDIIPGDSEFKPLVETTSTTGRRAIKKLLNRVDSLLDVAKMETGQLGLDTSPTEIATLIDTVCIELSPLAHELGIQIQTLLPPEYPLLEIDGDKVERVLLNLLDNALKFSPEDGIVKIRAFTPGTRSAPDGYSRIEVVDNGPGVPLEYRETLFNRFVQVPGRAGKRRGTGLGLTFCRLVAESHGGRIWIEDNPEGGTIFAFTLPVASTPR